ncbi:MAG: marine proteobacterial sortase target protein, partial [Gammaproteobacteria bacterium]|nr:marine proteobacterial sortase target protein [Gammaproteobacteria bacterium]
MRIKKLQRSLVLLILSVIFSPQLFADQKGKEAGSGRLILIDQAGIESESILLSMEIQLNVTAMTARVRLQQKFSNPSTQWVNAKYVFPMPETAAVHAMTLKIGERVIQGEVQEKREAKKNYEKAKKSGRQASLVEAERRNLFTLSVANIAPGQIVEVELVYLQVVDYRQGEFSLRLPTTLTPRYIPGKPLMDDADLNAQLSHGSSGWGQDTDEVTDASRITPVQVSDSGDSHTIQFTAILDVGLNLQSISSPSHEVDWRRDSGSYQVKFKYQNEKMDRDIVLRWLPVPLDQPHSAFFTEEIDGRSYATLMLMPPTTSGAGVLPREVIFVIDTSGSMQGASMPQARRSLQLAFERLQPQDTFNIIDFDSSAHQLFSESKNVNQRNLEIAREFVHDLVANGGTNMAAALDLALVKGDSENRLRQIVFITDGSVGNEAALFAKIANKLGSSRLFTVGIGSAPNSFFMRKAAQFGRGTFTYVEPGSSIEKRMSELFSQLEKPSLRDIRVDWPESSDVDQLPKNIPDLYYGEPLLITAQLNSGMMKVHISGQLAGQQWHRTLSTRSSIRDSGLATLWARKKIDQLIDSMVTGAEESSIKPEVIK